MPGYQAPVAPDPEELKKVGRAGPYVNTAPKTVPPGSVPAFDMSSPEGQNIANGLHADGSQPTAEEIALREANRPKYGPPNGTNTIDARANNAVNAATHNAQTDVKNATTGAVGGLEQGLGQMDNSGQFGPGPSKVGEAAGQAAGALGGAPTVNQALADRGRSAINEGLDMSRNVVDRLVNGPSTAERLGSQVLRSQMAMARSAAGGPGAVAGAMRAAMNAAPELQAQAAQSAVQERQQALTAAGGVANNVTTAALGARGQDIDVAQKNVDAGVAVKGMVANLAGTQLDLDEKTQSRIGEMAVHLAEQKFNWGSLDAQTQSKMLEGYLTQYGVEANTASQMALLVASGKITMSDILDAGVGVIGAAGSIAAKTFK